MKDQNEKQPLKERSLLRGIIFAIILFLLGRNIILVRERQIEGFEAIFRQFSGYFVITLSVILALVTVYRITKKIFPKRG